MKAHVLLPRPNGTRGTGPFADSMANARKIDGIPRGDPLRFTIP